MSLLQSSNQDSWQEDEKAEKEDRSFSSRLSIHVGDNLDDDHPTDDQPIPRTRRQWKENHLLHTSQSMWGHNLEEKPDDDFSASRKVHDHSKVKSRQDAVYWINSARAQDKGLQFWQTRSHAMMVCSSLPAECIYKVISQNGEELYMKDSRRLGLPRRLCSRVPRNRSSSKTVLKVHLLAPRNWCAKWKESRKRIKGARQKIWNYPAPGTCVRRTSQLLKKSLNFKSTSELKELHKM